MRARLAGKAVHILLVAMVGILSGSAGLVYGAAQVANSPHSEAYKAFDKYVRLTEERISIELSPASTFLHVDGLKSDDRDAAYGKLRRGEVRIESLTTQDRGQKIVCPGCMIEHWAGTIFIPGATLDGTLKLVQDYDHQAEYYAPDVMQAKTISHSGEDFHIFMRFHRTMIVTVVLDTEHNVHYQRIDATHATSRAVSTRIQEVANVGKASEHDLAEGKDNGYLWRINNYWRFLERDGGVYVQCESVSLSRDIPAGLGWLVTPFAESVPKESLRFTLEATRKQLVMEQSVGASR